MRRLAAMALAGRRLVVAICIAACFTPATCKDAQWQADDDTLFFRRNQIIDNAAETNLENPDTVVSAENDFRENQEPGVETEANVRGTQKIYDAIETNVRETQKTGDAIETNVRGTQKTGDAIETNVRGTQKTGDAIETNVRETQKTGDAIETNVRGTQKPGVAKETNVLGTKKIDDATKTKINADTEDEDMKMSIEVGKPNKNILDYPWWPSFLLGLTNSFYHQPIKERSQFSVLYMGNEYTPHQNKFPLKFHPSNKDGTPIINDKNTLSPSSRQDYVNYVAARPENVPYQCSMKHAELRILDEMTHLWTSYHTHNSHPPNMIVLYSWIMPCPECTEKIIEYFKKAPFSTVPYRVVAYTTEGTDSNLAYMTTEGNRKSQERLNDNGITYWKQQCKRPDDLEQHGVDKSTTSTGSHVCKLSDTFQGCFMDCLGCDFCCSCKESRKMSMNAAIVNDLAKDCATSDMKTCASTWVHNAFSEQRSGASSCTDLHSARAKLLSCANTCVGRPLSKPLNPLNPSSYPGYLVKFSDISTYAPVRFTDFCTDIRAEGYLCYNYRADSFTAGNSLCKTGSVCGDHGYSYNWCYTVFGSWDYCCTSACSYKRTSSYLSCHSGSTWQYCGEAGDNTVKDRHCLAKYPCGMHQEKGKENYYWCYTDSNKNWGYCCQPGDTCSMKGKSHDWCYTGYKKKEKPQSCNK